MRRVLVNDHSGHAFPIQLSRYLARKGYEIIHTFSKSFQTPKGPLEPRDTDSKNLTIKGIKLSKPFLKYSYVKRRFQEREYGLLLADIIKSFRPEILISCNTPLYAQSVIQSISFSVKSKFVFWVQDIYSIAIRNVLSQKVPYLGSMLAHYFKKMEQRQLLKSDRVVLITEDFLPLMKSWEIDIAKCSVIPNWAPLDDLPILPKINHWSVKNELHNKTCIVYSGTLGLKHNPALLVSIAEHFKSVTDVRIVVVSEGLGADYLRSRREELNLSNLLVMNYQPFESLPAVLSTADILIAVLEPEAGIFSVPSKVLTYLCFKKPLILAVPKENLASRIVKENNAGIVADPRDTNWLIAQMDELLRNPAARKTLGENAYRYAENHFDIERIGNSFEKIIIELM